MSAASRNQLVAAEVRAELARQKMSVRTLAQTTGYSFDVIRPRVSGETPFNLDQLHAVGVALGVRATEFMDRANNRSAA